MNPRKLSSPFSLGLERFVHRREAERRGVGERAWETKNCSYISGAIVRCYLSGPPCDRPPNQRGTLKPKSEYTLLADPCSTPRQTSHDHALLAGRNARGKNAEASELLEACVRGHRQRATAARVRTTNIRGRTGAVNPSRVPLTFRGGSPSSPSRAINA